MTKLLIATQFIAITLLIFLGSTPLNAQQAIKDVKGCIEAVYVLEESKVRGEVFRPPQIVGRFIVLNGTVTFVFHDRTQQSGQTSYVGIGKYTATASQYSYGYDDYYTYTHTDAGILVSREVPFEGMRSFAPAIESDGIYLRTADSQQSIQCTPDGLTYSLGGGNYRKYRRTKSE
jgi:hypothetical protein